MIAIAKAAGVSRQAVYLHFADRAQLLLALSDYIDEEVGVGGWMDQIAELGDGRDMLRLLALTRSRRSASIASLNRAIETARRKDEAVSRAWQQRHEATVDWMKRVIVRRLREEGRLHPSWKPKRAASFLVMLFALRNWDNLIDASGWSAREYVEIVTAAALSAMAGGTRPENAHEG